MRRKTWDTGNLFAVPLSDGSCALGQVIGREAEVLNSITCSFYRTPISAQALDSVRSVPAQSDLIAVQFTTYDQLTRRVWKVLGNYPVALPRELFPHEDKRVRGWVGAKVVGSAIIADLLSAYHGLVPWNVMYDQDYYDHLLAPGVTRPTTAVVLSAADREAYRKADAS